MRRTLTLIGAIFSMSTATAFPAPHGDALTTHAERTSFAQTGRYDEVIALCAAFARAYPKSVRCIDFGVSPEGRVMKALVANTSGVLDAKRAAAKNYPVLYAQGGIHSGEIEGKDAGFLLLRELLEGKVAPGILDAQVLLFVPVFSVDGHENFRAWQRPNQRGPEEMGFRTTAQRYNLNRDYVKADAPEMRALLTLVNEWDPLIQMDLHATDGAKFQHDISITGEPVNAGDQVLRTVGRALRDGIIEKLAAQGSTPVAFYPSFDVEDDPASGFSDSVSAPRFSHGYYPLRNRMAILVETHSWKDYPTRVRITRNSILAMLELTRAHGAAWLTAARAADSRSAALGGNEIAVDYKTTDKVKTIDFLGYAYTRTPSEISGALMTRYDESKPEIWKIPLRDEVVPSVFARVPKGGYIVPPHYAAFVGEKLRLHGIAFNVLSAPLTGVRAEMFKASSARFSPTSSENHQRATIEGAWSPTLRDVRAQALFVPTAQAKAQLIVHMLDPIAPDSLAAWGFFNGHFEHKEYMEDYVAEEEARKMLERLPEVKAAFEKRVRNDEAFAKNPKARLEFFYRLHPAWDDGLDVYPIMRTDAAL